VVVEKDPQILEILPIGYDGPRGQPSLRLEVLEKAVDVGVHVH
jgi:hypothetical protein